MGEDYYSILGVARDAAEDELKRAYRKLAMECHPDRHHGDKECEEKFKRLSEAYSCLSDPEKRANYDRYGTAEGVGAGVGGFGDIFEDVFGEFFGAFTGKRGPRASRGVDLRYDLGITLREAAFGTEKFIDILKWESCGVCKGTGSRTGRATACPDCGGRGQVRFQQGFFSISKTCPRCRGQGAFVTDPCAECKGQGKVRVPRRLSIKVPAGVDTDSRLKMSGEGDPGQNGGPPGDLYIILNVESHEFFRREGADLYCEIPITFAQAVLGDEIEVPTMEGSARLSIPGGTQPGKSFRLKGKGVARLGTRSKGDQVVVITLDVPKDITQRQREILEEFDNISRENGSGSLMDRIKHMFAGSA